MSHITIETVSENNICAAVLSFKTY